MPFWELHNAISSGLFPAYLHRKILLLSKKLRYRNLIIEIDILYGI